MVDDTSSRFPKLGKLGLALLEHLAEPVIGKDAREVIKAPTVEKELRITLAQILAEVENRFTTTYHDREISAALVDLSLATLPSLQVAVRAFYTQPTDYALHQMMSVKLSETLPSLTKGQVEQAVDSYLAFLKEQLVAAAPTPEFREKIGVLLLQSMQADTHQIQQVLSEILTLMKSRPHSEAETAFIELQKHQPDYAQTQQIIVGILEMLKLWRLPTLSSPILQSNALQPRDNERRPIVGPTNQYDRLRGMLDYLVDEEFRDVIRSMLPTPQEQGVLPRPISLLSRGEFLGHIQMRRRLDELEKYLCGKYPQFFST